MKKNKSPRKKIFGVNFHREDISSIPPFILESIQYVQRFAPVVGLFRRSGNQKVILELEQLIENGKKISYENILNVHDICGLIRKYLMRLPEPLLTFYCYNMFIAAETVSFKNRRRELIKKIIMNDLYPSHKFLFQVLMKLCYSIDRKKEVTRMDAKCLAILFAPTLLRSETDEINFSMVDQKNSVNLLVSIIEDYEYFFTEDEILKERKEKNTPRPVRVNLMDRDVEKNEEDDDDDDDEDNEIVGEFFKEFDEEMKEMDRIMENDEIEKEKVEKDEIEIEKIEIKVIENNKKEKDEKVKDEVEKEEII